MDIRDTLLGIFQELEFDSGEIEDSTNLRNDLAVDSTELAEITVAIESKLLVVIDDEEFQRLQTFGDVIRYVADAPHAA
jgi:acyl carrier protein